MRPDETICGFKNDPLCSPNSCGGACAGDDIRPTRPIHETMIDIITPEHGVQVQIRADGKVLLVHVDGVTVLRICQIPYLNVVDTRPQHGRFTRRLL